MNRRSLSTICAAALISLTVGGTLARWLDRPDIPLGVPHFGQTVPAAGGRPALPDGARNRRHQAPTASAENLSLRLDDRLGTDAGGPAIDSKTATASQSADSAVTPSEPSSPSETASAKKPLNLKLPAGKSPGTPVESADAQPATYSAVPPDSRQPAVMFDLNPKPLPQPKVETYSLFNPEYGLRGFMKQSWITHHVGFQGGLGLNDDRRIATDDDGDLRNDIAVGMGVIFAF